MSKLGFVVEKMEPIKLIAHEMLHQRQLMSPFVWKDEKGGYHILIRAVPQASAGDGHTGRIWYGHCGGDGLNFEMDHEPLLVPGPEPTDALGCEDPTVVPIKDEFIVYYTGLDKKLDARMLYARGRDIHALEKKGIVFQSAKTERNTKEAVVEITEDGEWRMFYEFSRDMASVIGLAIGDGPAGPWRERSEPIKRRENSWDNWHLSTGPLLMDDPKTPVMFYNGATRDAKWRIGWAAFTPDFERVVQRSGDPLISPGERGLPNRDIAFAASQVIVGNRIWLYYSVDDCTLCRAIVRRA